MVTSPRTCSKSCLVTGTSLGFFAFVASWNEFAASLVILTTAENQPLAVAITKFVGQYDSAWQYVFGVSIVGIVPVIVLFALVEKRLVAGLTAGAVK
jgi:multiple sugar transport system permease protein